MRYHQHQQHHHYPVQPQSLALHCLLFRPPPMGSISHLKPLLLLLLRRKSDPNTTQRRSTWKLLQMLKPPRLKFGQWMPSYYPLSCSRRPQPPFPARQSMPWLEKQQEAYPCLLFRLLLSRSVSIPLNPRTFLCPHPTHFLLQLHLQEPTIVLCLRSHLSRRQ